MLPHHSKTSGGGWRAPPLSGSSGQDGGNFGERDYHRGRMPSSAGPDLRQTVTLRTYPGGADKE